MDALRAAMDAGASSIVSQFFFDNDSFLRFEDRVRIRGIDAPVVAGIMPVVDFSSALAISAAQHVSVPDFLHDHFAGLTGNRQEQLLVSAGFLADQLMSLADRSVHDFYLFALNHVDIVYGACRMSGLFGCSSASRHGPQR